MTNRAGKARQNKSRRGKFRPAELDHEEARWDKFRRRKTGCGKSGQGESEREGSMWDKFRRNTL
jgi:hypothetical protein